MNLREMMIDATIVEKQDTSNKNVQNEGEGTSKNEDPKSLGAWE